MPGMVSSHATGVEAGALKPSKGMGVLARSSVLSNRDTCRNNDETLFCSFAQGARVSLRKIISCQLFATTLEDEHIQKYPKRKRPKAPQKYVPPHLRNKGAFAATVFTVQTFGVFFNGRVPFCSLGFRGC
eukprot:4351876-Amphidinium_carterae.1